MRISPDRVDDWYLVVLTAAETNRFFETFDPHDRTMPSYLHRVGHRYIREFIYNWLVENFGPDQQEWTITQHYDVAKDERVRVFHFKNPDHAMLFVTMWSGAPLGDER
jgi:hypothetical protein